MYVSRSVLRERSEATTNSHCNTAAKKPSDGNLARLYGASVSAIRVTGWATDKLHHSESSSAQSDSQSNPSDDCKMFREPVHVRSGLTTKAQRRRPRDASIGTVA